LFLTGCAAREAHVQLTADLRAADELVQAGCYTCLRDAVALYDRLARARRSPPGLSQPFFEATVLLALRAKELGLPFEESLGRAKAIGNTLPPSVDASTVLELAELVPQETSGLAPRPPGASRFVSEVVPAIAHWRERVAATGLSASTKQYLDLTLACADRATRAELEAAPPTPAAPLVRYRLATCGPAATEDAGRLLADDPRWSEAAWFEGRRVLGAVQDLTQAIPLLATAAHAFPESGAMLMSLAGVQLAASQTEPALATYDAVIELVPEHRGALLGRVLALTYLERHDEAVVSATRMIDLGTHLLSDAYYWRALNRHEVKAVDEAWADVTVALTLQVNTNVHTLAGLIAYARKQLDTALTHFDRAWTLDSSNCNAAFYKGIVHGDVSAWRDAAPTFSAAMSCYTSAAATLRAALATLQASDQSEPFKASKGAEHQKTIDESERQAAVSAYNAAQAFARTGQTTSALNHLDIAIAHDAMREKAETLRRLLSPPRER
jgi:tetratricopeptide (TPR) repeat protein